MGGWVGVWVGGWWEGGARYSETMYLKNAPYRKIMCW